MNTQGEVIQSPEGHVDRTSSFDMESIFAEQVLNQQKLDQQKKKTVCKYGYHAPLVCSNQKCQQHGLICVKKLCQCQNLHKNCLMVTLDSILKSLSQRSNSLKPIQQTIQKYIQQAILMLSKYKQNLIKTIHQKYQFLGFTDDQVKFIKSIKSGKYDNICGMFTQNVLSTNDLDNRINVIVPEVKQDVLNVWENFSEQLQKFNNKLTEMLNRCTRIQETLLWDSRMIKTGQQVKKLRQFFEVPIKSAKLLYRASEHNFELPKFFQNCTSYKNTLTIIKTQFDKVIGGFTPLQWFVLPTAAWVVDETNKSFLFSLTNSDKFTLTKKQNTIYRSTNNTSYGPTFGAGNDLYIVNKSHEANCTANFNNTYTNTNYKAGETTSFQKFSGSKTANFKTKEWQTWQIQFQK